MYFNQSGSLLTGFISCHQSLNVRRNTRMWWPVSNINVDWLLKLRIWCLTIFSLAHWAKPWLCKMFFCDSNVTLEVLFSFIIAHIFYRFMLLMPDLHFQPRTEESTPDRKTSYLRAYPCDIDHLFVYTKFDFERSVFQSIRFFVNWVYQLSLNVRRNRRNWWPVSNA